MRRILPQAFETKAVAKKKLQDEVNGAFERIEKLQLATMVDMEIEISETQALLLISTKVSFIALMYLKLLSAHIPASYTMIPSGSEVPLRFIFISDILKQKSLLCLLPNRCHTFNSWKITVQNLWNHHLT